MIKPYPHVTQHFVGKPADHHECALLRAELAAQARDIHVMSLEIARLRPYEHTLKHAVELAEQGRGADALDVLKAALNHPASLYSKQPCCSPEAGN